MEALRSVSTGQTTVHEMTDHVTTLDGHVYIVGPGNETFIVSSSVSFVQDGVPCLSVCLLICLFLSLSSPVLPRVLICLMHTFWEFMLPGRD